MAVVEVDKSNQQVEPKHHEIFDQFVAGWSDIFHPMILWPTHLLSSMRVEEFRENGTLVVRAELPGMDPDKDLKISVTDDVLRVDAQRREEERAEGRDYVRREHRYGTYHRELVLPRGTSDADIKASYKDGILEIRVPMPEELAETGKKIPITTS